MGIFLLYGLIFYKLGDFKNAAQQVYFSATNRFRVQKYNIFLNYANF